MEQTRFDIQLQAQLEVSTVMIARLHSEKEPERVINTALNALKDHVMYNTTEQDKFMFVAYEGETLSPSIFSYDSNQYPEMIEHFIEIAMFWLYYDDEDAAEEETNALIAVVRAFFERYHQSIEQAHYGTNE